MDHVSVQDLSLPKRSPVVFFYCIRSHSLLFFITVPDHKTLYIPVNNSMDPETLFAYPHMNSTYPLRTAFARYQITFTLRYQVRYCNTDPLLFHTHFPFPRSSSLKKNLPMQTHGVLLVWLCYHILRFLSFTLFYRTLSSFTRRRGTCNGAAERDRARDQISRKKNLTKRLKM